MRKKRTLVSNFSFLLTSVLLFSIPRAFGQGTGYISGALGEAEVTTSVYADVNFAEIHGIRSCFGPAFVVLARSSNRSSVSLLILVRKTFDSDGIENAAHYELTTSHTGSRASIQANEDSENIAVLVRPGEVLSTVLIQRGKCKSLDTGPNVLIVEVHGTNTKVKILNDAEIVERLKRSMKSKDIGPILADVCRSDKSTGLVLREPDDVDANDEVHLLEVDAIHQMLVKKSANLFKD